jgi:hypothetical protein
MKTIKRIGLAALAALALTSLVGTASVSAAGIQAGKYPSRLAANNSGNHTLLVAGASIECSGANIVAPTSSVGVKESVTVTPYYSSCFGFFQYKSIEMNGCSFILHPTSETLDIGPAGCGPITRNTEFCNIGIPAQNGLKATFTNTGSGESAKVEIKVNATGIKYTTSGPMCGVHTYTDGKYTGTWNAYGETQTGAITSLQVNNTFLAGLQLAAKGFTADAYPVPVTGNQTSAEQIFEGFNGSTGNCKTVQYNGTLSSQSTSLSVEPVFGSCTFGGFPADVNTNHCVWKFDAEPVSMTGQMSPSCSAGKSMDIKVYLGVDKKTLLCTVSIEPGATSGGATFGNAGSGSTRKVEVVANISGMKFTTSGTLCPEGPATTAKFKGNSALLAGV